MSYASLGAGMGFMKASLVGTAEVDAVGREVTDPFERYYFDYSVQRLRVTVDEIVRLSGGRRLEVLDVGCFPFHLGSVLQRLGHMVHGVCSEHEPVDRPRITQLNIETDRFPWDDASFDLVVFAEVIEHLVQSPVPPLREMRRITRPTGHLLVTTPNLASARQRLLLLSGRSVMYSLDAYFTNDGKGDLVYHRHNREYTRAELRSLLERSGWNVERVDYFTAYPRLFIDRPEKGYLNRQILGRLKHAAHHLVPGGLDNLLAVANPNGTLAPSAPV